MTPRMNAPASTTVDGPDVLVVEDDHDIREMMLFWLSGHGLSTVAAENGERARRLLLAGVRPRVILLDLMMPVMDGWMFSAWQARDPDNADIPVIVISAVGPGNPPLAVPPAARFDKPVNLDTALATIRAVVTQSDSGAES